VADLSKLVNELSQLTVLETTELTKMLEEKWSVNATGLAVQEYISEADAATFEGWLRNVQGFDPSALTSDELAQWRAIFDEINKSPTPKVGLMKLRSLPGEHRYAVAIRKGSELWLTLWVRRSPKGEFFVMVPRADRGWDPHNSYHLDGTFHSKSHGRVLSEKKLQPLTGQFRGTEHLGGYGGTAQALGQFAIRRPSPGLSRWRLVCWGLEMARLSWTW
jgi:hypothetical protein